MALPKITIVTPSFNQGRYIEQTIRSVLDQGYPNLEYFIVDGGSTDESVDVIRKYEKHLAGWVSEKDTGQSHAINKGFCRASGDLFAYINSDDYFEPGALHHAAKAYEEGHQWIVGWARYLEADGGEWPYPVKACVDPAHWFVHNPIPQQSTFWSSQLWKKVGGFSEELHYSFDYEYWMRLRFEGRVSPYVVHQCLAVFRLHGESKTMAEGDRFHPENDEIHRMYWHNLSPSRRLIVRHRRRLKEANALRGRAWQALNTHDLAAARKYAFSTFSRASLSIESWRVLFCAIRGY
ncbi:MAG: glycosyltransferase family 2 protein [Tepidisphaeraceae bacterium]